MRRNPFRRELSIWADFNSIDDERRIIASLRFADSPARPIEGEWIRLHDDEGNTVSGVVEKIDEMIVYVRPEMTTWTSSAISIDSPFVGQAPFRREMQAEPARE